MAKKTTKIIEARLNYALQDFTKDISDKKFKKHIRKACKILREGLELPVSSGQKKKSGNPA